MDEPAGSLLRRLHEAGVLDALDCQLARTLTELVDERSEWVRLGIALASRAVAHGHVCADLRQLVARPLIGHDGHPLDIVLPRLLDWVVALGETPLASRGEHMTPLVFDDEGRLYLRRYWSYQQRLAASLRARVGAAKEHSDHTNEIDDFEAAQLRAALQRLFDSASDTADPHQMRAVVVAVRHRFMVLTGGPGTGKTTTVARMLALLLEQARERNLPAPRVLLLAPTGKAAARLAESIERGRHALNTDTAIRDAIVPRAQTVHRALGYQPQQPTKFRYHADNPLPADIVVVDEASMIDLAMMTKLVEATPRRARLVLLGDPDQLASVEAGAILGDICNTTSAHRYSQAFARELNLVVDSALVDDTATVPSRGLFDCVAPLRRSFRFADDAGIGTLARAVRDGRSSDIAATFRACPEQLTHIEVDDAGQLRAQLKPLVLRAFLPLRTLPTPHARLQQLNTMRVLCAHRRGREGAEQLNRMVEDILEMHSGGTRSREHYDGQPIMVTTNDYQLELYNGDCGIIARDSNGRLRAWFDAPEGGLRSLIPSRLPPHQSVYAMTVHKSQGSEFDQVVLILPPARSPVLTRELIYTAVTRAKQHVTVLGAKGVIEAAIARRVHRASGLRDALYRG